MTGRKLHDRLTQNYGYSKSEYNSSIIPQKLLKYKARLVVCGSEKADNDEVCFLAVADATAVELDLIIVVQAIASHNIEFFGTCILTEPEAPHLR